MSDKISYTEKQLVKLLDFFMYDIPPGPRILNLYSVINLQKVGTLFYLLGMMWYFQNWSDTMCLYTVMHGSYGMLWYLKHVSFPDKTYQQTCTVACALVCWITLLGPYLVPGYLMASGQCYRTKDSVSVDTPLEPSKIRKWLSLFLYIVGVCLTLTADG